jgi:hypothetical protein
METNRVESGVGFRPPCSVGLTGERSARKSIIDREISDLRGPDLCAGGLKAIASGCQRRRGHAARAMASNLFLVSEGAPASCDLMCLASDIEEAPYGARKSGLLPVHRSQAAL